MLMGSSISQVTSWSSCYVRDKVPGTTFAVTAQLSKPASNHDGNLNFIRVLFIYDLTPSFFILGMNLEEMRTHCYTSVIANSGFQTCK